MVHFLRIFTKRALSLLAISFIVFTEPSFAQDKKPVLRDQSIQVRLDVEQLAKEWEAIERIRHALRVPDFQTGLKMAHALGEEYAQSSKHFESFDGYPVPKVEQELVNQIMRKLLVVMDQSHTKETKILSQFPNKNFFIVLGIGLYEIGVAVYVADVLVTHLPIGWMPLALSGIGSVAAGLAPLIPFAYYLKKAPQKKTKRLIRAFAEGFLGSSKKAKELLHPKIELRRFSHLQEFLQAQMMNANMKIDLFNTCQGSFR